MAALVDILVLESTGWAEKQGHYVTWPLRLTAYIFKTPESICNVSDIHLLQRRFDRKKSANYNVIKFIAQSDAIRISLLTTAAVISA